MSVHGPGVASIDSSDALQVHSLPGLGQLCRKQLEDSRVLGFRWSCATSDDAAGGGSGSAGGTACCSLDGQLVLAAAGNELARLAVVEDCALPAAPPAVYDMRVAQAAAAAAAAAAATRRPAVAGRAGSAGFPVQQQREQQQAEGSPATSPQAADAAQRGQAAGGFGRFFDQAASTVTGLATSAAGSVMQVGGQLTGVGVPRGLCLPACCAGKPPVVPGHDSRP